MLTMEEKIYFWAGVMRDHAEFFIMNLSSREEDFIKKAKAFKKSFEDVMGRAKTSTFDIQREVLPLLHEFIEFKKTAIKRLLICDIELNMPPTFINHMVNEAMEFYRDLTDTKPKEVLNIPEENITIHKIWLPDASGHAAAIADDLDPTEQLIIKEAQSFQKIFNTLFIKAVELGQMLGRTGLRNGALEMLNEEAYKYITDFIMFLEKIKALREKCKAMGVLPPIMPDHMIREEKYYLLNIEKFQNAK